MIISYHNSMRKSILDFNFFLAYNKDVEKEGETKMDIAFLKLGIAVFIAIVGVYICFNVVNYSAINYRASCFNYHCI